jgi:hypothetical protein
MFYTAQDIMEMLDIGRSKAYEIIKTLNAELNEEGYITVAGKVSKKYFHQRVYGTEE